jgi:death-on-curing protein
VGVILPKELLTQLKVEKGDTLFVTEATSGVTLTPYGLAEHGGAEGLRDEGLPESALARPQHLEVHGNPDLADLAAAYGVGLAKNHPFVDGNECVAFLAVGVFLALNGQRLVASQAEATLTMLGIASGELEEAAFAAWIRPHSARR